MSVRDVYSYAYVITSCARALDHNPEKWRNLLAGTGILPEQLKDPYLRIDRIQEQTFFRNVMLCHPAPDTNIRLGRALGLYGIGVLGYLLRPLHRPSTSDAATAICCSPAYSGSSGTRVTR